MASFARLRKARPSAPKCQLLPLISGTARVGDTLTVAPGSYDRAVTITRQWVNSTDGVLSGQTATTYTAVTADQGDTLYVSETATDAHGASVTVSSPVTSAVLPVVPVGGVLPASQTAAFGIKTPVGYGGKDLSYTGVGYLAVTSASTGNAAHWQIDAEGATAGGPCYLTPKNLAGAYGAGPPTFLTGNGAYVLTITEYSDAGHTTPTGVTGQVTVNMIANAMHVRWRGNSLDNNNSNQLLNLLKGSGSTYYPQRGETIYLRDGQYLPGNDSMTITGPGSSSTSWTNSAGTGRLTVRSENPGSACDADSNPSPRIYHGAKMGRLVLRGGYTGAWPLDFRDLDFYCATSTSFAMVWISHTTSGGNGVNFYNNSFRHDVHAYPKSRAINLFASTSANGVDGIAEGNYFYGCNYIILMGDGTTSRNNHAEQFSSDIHSVNASSNVVIEDNFVHDPYYDGASHCDFAQWNVQANSPSGCIIRRNVIIRGAAANSSGADVINGALCFATNVTSNPHPSGFQIYQNLVCTNSQNAVHLSYHDNPNVYCNTVVNDPLNIVTPGITTYISLDHGDLNIWGTDATFQRNIGSAIYMGTQQGTVVEQYDYQTGSAAAGIVAMLPSYTGTQTVTTKAGARAMFTPALNGSAKNGDGTYSGAIFPNGALNTGAVYP